jgi:hypothetical protein
VPTPDFDDERDDLFEAYLKQFRPLAVEPLPTKRPGHTIRRRYILTAMGAAAAVLVAAVLTFHSHPQRIHPTSGLGNGAGVEQLTEAQPLTIGSANALLVQSPSVDAALDRVPFHPPSTVLPKGKQSALAVLSEDNDKL